MFTFLLQLFTVACAPDSFDAETCHESSQEVSSQPDFLFGEEAINQVNFLVGDESNQPGSSEQNDSEISTQEDINVRQIFKVHSKQVSSRDVIVFQKIFCHLLIVIISKYVNQIVILFITLCSVLLQAVVAEVDDESNQCAGRLDTSQQVVNSFVSFHPL